MTAFASRDSARAAPVPFHLAYPAPWRIQGEEIVDVDGSHVIGIESDIPEDLVLWQGIVDAVNLWASHDRVLRAARAL